MTINEKKIVAKNKIMKVLEQDLSLLKVSFCQDQLENLSNKIVDLYLAKKPFGHLINNLTKGK